MAEVANPTPDPTGLALSYNNGSLTVTWRTDWYPPTFRVVLTISDQAGNPLDPPPTISMGNGQATVTGKR